MNVTIYQQECHGQEHWRVVRDDGYRIFDRLQTDFPAEDEAIMAVRGEARRHKLEPVQIRICYMPQQGLGTARQRIINSPSTQGTNDER